MKVSIIGAGNVATQLALALRRAGHTIVQVCNRSSDAGTELAKTVGAAFINDLKLLTDADIYVIAVKDDAIADIASQLHLGDKTVVHTSGTKTSDILSFSSSNFGVFYPLQTMTKFDRVDFNGIPILVEANNEATLNKLEELGKTLSRNIYKVDEQQRQWVHVSAVFANNFVNHLFTISEDLLKERGLQFDILKPLIMRSVESLNKFSPAQVQTGPAMRGDYLTIDKHVQLLADHKNVQKIYEILSDSIIASADKEQKTT